MIMFSIVKRMEERRFTYKLIGSQEVIVANFILFYYNIVGSDAMLKIVS